MTTVNTKTTAIWVGNGVASSYDTNIDQSYTTQFVIERYINDIFDRVLVLDVDYTSPDFEETEDPETFAITLEDPLPVGTTLVIRRDTPAIQERELNNKNGLVFRIFERLFDEVTFRDQEIRAEMDRTIRTSILSGAPGPKILSALPNRLMAFDADGNITSSLSLDQLLSLEELAAILDPENFGDIDRDFLADYTDAKTG